MLFEEVFSEIPFEASQADLSVLKKAINWLPKEDLEATIPKIIQFEMDKNDEQRTHWHQIF